MENWFLTILITSITMGIIGVGYLLMLPKLSKHYSPKGLYTVWLVILLGLLIPFRPVFPASLFKIPEESLEHVIVLPEREALTSTQPVQPLHNVPSIQPVSKNTIPLSQLTENSKQPKPDDTRKEQSSTYTENEVSAAKELPSSIALWQLLSILWFAGAVLFVGWHIWTHIRFTRKINRWKIPLIQGETAQIFFDLKTQMHINKRILLYHCPAVSTPMLIGFLKPQILLPLVSNREKEATYILKHELTHYKQKDLWVKALMLAATAIHWFNPVIYLLMNRITLWCELACDTRTVENTDLSHRSAYCEAILDIARYHTNQYTAFSTPFIGGKKTMKTRIYSILDTKNKKIGSFLLLLTLIVTLSTGLILSASTAAEPEMTGEVTGFTKEQFKGLEENVSYVTSPALMKNVFYTLTDSGNLYTWDATAGENFPIEKLCEVSVDGNFTKYQGGHIPVTHLLPNGPTERELWVLNDVTGNIGKITPEGVQWEVSKLNTLGKKGNYTFKQGYIRRSTLYGLCYKDGNDTQNTYLLSLDISDPSLVQHQQIYEIPDVIGLYPYKTNKGLLLQKVEKMLPPYEKEGSGLVLSIIDFSDDGKVTPLPNNIVFNLPSQGEQVPAGIYSSVEGVAYDEDRDIIYYSHNQKLFASVQGEAFIPVGSVSVTGLDDVFPRQGGWVMPDGRYALAAEEKIGKNNLFQSLHVYSPETIEEEIVDFSNHQAMLYSTLLPEPANPDYYYSDKMCLYSQPDENSDVLMEYFQSAPLTVLETHGEWVKVRMGSTNGGYLDGYIKEELLVYKGGQTHYPVQSFQDEYVTANDEMILYTTPDKNSESNVLPTNTPISVIGQYGGWMHVRIAPLKHAKFAPTQQFWDDESYYNYWWPTPEANEENLVTGFIPGSSPRGVQKISRAVIDADGLADLYDADDVTKKLDYLLVSGTEVYALEYFPREREEKIIEIQIPTDGEWIKAAISNTELAFRYFRANNPSTIAEIPLSSTGKKDIVLHESFPVNDQTGIIATYPNGVKGKILGQLPADGLYIAEVEGKTGYIKGEFVSLPDNNPFPSQPDSSQAMLYTDRTDPPQKMYLYNEPSEDSSVLMEYTNSTPVTILEKADDVWTKVRVGSISGGYLDGYIKEMYLSYNNWVQTWQKEYLTQHSDIKFYSNHNKKLSYEYLPYQAVISVLGEYGEYWHVRIAPYQQAQYVNQGYYWVTPKADEESLVTGFITQNSYQDLKRVYRAVIDSQNTDSLPSLALTDDLSPYPNGLLLNGTEVLCYENSAPSSEDVTVFLNTADGGKEFMISQKDLNYQYHYPSKNAADIVQVTLKSENEKDIPVKQDPLNTGKPIATLSKGTMVTVLGKIFDPIECYLVLVNDIVGYLDPEYITLPDSYVAPFYPTSAVNFPLIFHYSYNNPLRRPMENTYGRFIEGEEALDAANLPKYHFGGGSLSNFGSYSYFHMSIIPRKIDEAYLYATTKNPNYKATPLEKELYKKDPFNNVDDFNAMISAYSPFGISGVLEEESLYYKGKKIRSLVDNHCDPNPINPDWINRLTDEEGALLQEVYYFPDGEIDLVAIRDYTKTDKKGVGRLTGFEIGEPIAFELTYRPPISTPR